jgi:thermostable 8-oxoguanine DNA glycosylase
MQKMYAEIGSYLKSIDFPDPDEFILPNVKWGRFDNLLTPAFWYGQAWQHQQIGTYDNGRFGRNLIEEAAACLLGGFGMKAELGLAAFARLRDLGLLERPTRASRLEKELRHPFRLENGQCHYRFPRQKAQHLAGCLRAITKFEEPNCDLELRRKLLEFPGIGPKTASWIVRNYRGSNDVAIIDVHIHRACQFFGLFKATENPSRHYDSLENRFLQLANAMNTPASILDNLMWDYMRRIKNVRS